MDKGYENANEQVQVQYGIKQQFNPTTKQTRWWVEDRRGRKVSRTFSSYNEAVCERDSLNR